MSTAVGGSFIIGLGDSVKAIVRGFVALTIFFFHNAFTDFETPYALKLLSSAPISRTISYYFYTFLFERGANILARIMGASITSDGYHMVAPDPNGEQAGHAMTRAIQLAGLSPTDIDHVNAHATGTSVGDVAEGIAINGQRLTTTTAIRSAGSPMNSMRA